MHTVAEVDLVEAGVALVGTVSVAARKACRPEVVVDLVGAVTHLSHPKAANLARLGNPEHNSPGNPTTMKMEISPLLENQALRSAANRIVFDIHRLTFRLA